MNEPMQSIMARVREKQALQAAGMLLSARQDAHLFIKVSISALCGLAITLMPLVGAAMDMGTML